MVYNVDDPYSDFMREGFQGEQVSFGIKAEADYRGVMLAQYRNRMALGIDFVCRCAGQSTHVEVMSPVRSVRRTHCAPSPYAARSA